MNESTVEKADRTWDVLCHLSALAMFVGVPLGHIIGPLIIWLIKKGDSAAVDEHGKEALNFQISLSLYLILFTALTASLMFVLIGFLLLPVLIASLCLWPIIEVIFIIVASVKASNGELYRYPLTIRFLK